MYRKLQSQKFLACSLTLCLAKEPTAELRFGQKDSDSLPNYDLLDQFLFEYIENKTPIAVINIDGISEKEKYSLVIK